MIWKYVLLVGALVLESTSVPYGTVTSIEWISDSNGGMEGALGSFGWFGADVDVLGDVDRDGVSDLVVGASGSPASVYILFMNTNNSVREYTRVNTASHWPLGMQEPAAGQLFGTSVAALGDVNMDGVPDFAVGSVRGLASSEHGSVWIFFLNSDGTPSGGVYWDQHHPVLAPLLNLTKPVPVQFGAAITAVGDLDGDGVRDLLIGAPYDDDQPPSLPAASDYGAAYIVFLKSSGFPHNITKISGLHGGGGFPGTIMPRQFGLGVAYLGDMRHDGRAVAMVGGAPYGTSGNSVFLSLFPNGTVESATLLNGSLVRDSNEQFGLSAVSVGDLDSNGVDDVAVGSPYARMNGSTGFSGRVRVLLLDDDLDVVESIRIDTDTTAIVTYSTSARFGTSVTRVGNVVYVGALREGLQTGAIASITLHYACGDGMVTGVEVCDPAAGGACCAANCTFLVGMCREAAGLCDFAEFCAGASDQCPIDVRAPDGMECRPSAGSCDVSELCNGASPLCPVDAFRNDSFECRPVASTCDSAEFCPGTSALCPPDLPAGDERVCRAPAGPCDAPEVCPPASFHCPADILRPAGHACDDGDNCTGPVDRCSANGTCVPGPSDMCGGCPAGSVRDACGVCAGGDTGRIPDIDKDRCGVCFGDNLLEDECGQCSPETPSKDACGVCFGDNTTCNGCDGVPYSGLVYDTCGICAGDNSSCVGCDGVFVFEGGQHYDVCGVCGGDGTGCVFGCDGVEASSLLYDCNGGCNGSAVVDACNVCTGGSTGIPVNLHLGACGCFSINETCHSCSAFDSCGVCNGTGLTCVGCDNVTMSGSVIDACGVCNGNSSGSSCFFGCDGVQYSGKTYDCAGVCGGSSIIDDCGVCAGHTIPVNFHEDSCGICFGGNRLLDSCGVCRGNDSSRDRCGQCNRSDADMDTCGVCFGGNRARDLCGICHGDSTICLGCDMVPFSGLQRDACGVCGGRCVPPTSRHGQRNILVPTAIAGLVVSFLLLCMFCLMAASRKHHERRYKAELAALTVAEAPSGVVTLAVATVAGASELWESYPLDMPVAVEIYHHACRQTAEASHGYEVKMEGCMFVVAFQKAKQAISWTARLQLDLNNRKWPKRMMSSKHMAEVKIKGLPTFRGFRVRMGVHIGEPSVAFDERTERVVYSGPCVDCTYTVMQTARGGQVVVTNHVIAASEKHVLKAVKATKLTMCKLGSITTRGGTVHELHQIMPIALSYRKFKRREEEPLPHGDGTEIFTSRTNGDGLVITRNPIHDQSSLTTTNSGGSSDTTPKDDLEFIAIGEAAFPAPLQRDESRHTFMSASTEATLLTALPPLPLPDVPIDEVEELERESECESSGTDDSSENFG